MKKTISGLLVLDKPAGLSSRQALDYVTRLFPRTKMGHAGTLDPLATGVLVVCLGKATRLIPYVQQATKHYATTIRLGERSATHDLEAEVERVPDVRPVARNEFERVLERFRGEIEQVPPQHSAVRVAGRRAYDLARSGKSVTLAPRRVRIDRIECTRFEVPEADLEIECSSGTYVRSLVRDIGEALETGAVMTRLHRTAIGTLRIENALSPETLTRQLVADALLPMIAAVAEMPALKIDVDYRDLIRHGRPAPIAAGIEPRPGTECALVDDRDLLLAVGTVDRTGELVHPQVVVMDDAT